MLERVLTVAVQTMRRGRLRASASLWILLPLLILSLLVSAGLGAVPISPGQALSIVAAKLGLGAIAAFTDQQRAVFEVIRLPRVLLGGMVGAGLAVSGAALQGLFRNPLADPGLLGVSSGAALGATISIVLGFGLLGDYSLPFAAFLGSIAATAVIYALALGRRHTDVATMLLAGIAVNALCGAGTGLFTYMASDAQLRTIVFWQLGSLGGATWSNVLSVFPFIAASLVILPLLANSLNAMLLGESNAKALGVPVDLVKWAIVTLVALGVGAGVAVTGMIGFVGLVVPHLVRLWIGPNHRTLMPASALLGATLLVAADTIARLAVEPSELPIGIVTALAGAPFFLYMLLSKRKRSGT